MSRRAPLALATALMLVVGLAGPAPASNDVAVSGSTLTIHVPVAVEETEPSQGVQGSWPGELTRLAAPLGRERLHGCFAVKVRFGTGPQPHVLKLVPQRPGQFLRPSVTGDDDPYAGERELTIGMQAFEADDPLASPVGLLLTGEPPAAGRDALRSLVEAVISESGARDRLKPCAWKGALELTTVYDKYGLTITSTVPFTFTVNAAGKVDGKMGEATRSAVADDDQVGHCTGSGLEMFPIGLTGSSDGETFTLTFLAKGQEPDFHLSCTGGTADIAGDFLRTTFLPLGQLPFELNPRNGATSTVRNNLQGREGTAKVTISRA